MYYINHWIPAFAGMTAGQKSRIRHSSESWNPGGQCRGVGLIQVFIDLCQSGMTHWVVIPAFAGIYYINHWIPAFAGMTARRKSRIRHSSESSPAWMQVVEPRLEQAAEESRRVVPGCWVDSGFHGFAPGRDDTLGCHSRLCGHVLYKPLDSGLRRNDGEAEVKNPSFQRKLACMDAGGRAASGTSGRGIQGGDAGVLGWLRFP